MFFNDLIEALREELRQYGEMLARLDESAADITRTMSGEPLVGGTAVSEQEKVIALALHRREKVQRQLACNLCLPEGAGLPEIIPWLPRGHQLLVSALVDENKELSTRVRQRGNRTFQPPPRSFYPRQRDPLTAKPVCCRARHSSCGVAVGGF